jgi:hypothetical protein
VRHRPWTGYHQAQERITPLPALEYSFVNRIAHPEIIRAMMIKAGHHPDIPAKRLVFFIRESYTCSQAAIMQATYIALQHIS